MPDIEDVKEEFNRLDSKDKRWLVVSFVVAVAALVSAALGGSLLGDLIAFAATFAAGWFVHDQWNSLRGARRAPKQPRAKRAHRTPTRRKARTGTASKSH
ncbi:MAG: hypothetical protein ACLPVY_16625 [Acidimicrobiia bacterium]